MAVTVRSPSSPPGQAGRFSPWRLLAVVLLLAVVAAGAWLGGRATAPTRSSEDTAGPGPTGSEAGVPVGYAHSEAGAAAAAMNLLAALYGPGVDDQQEGAIDVLAADGAEEWITDHLAEIDARPLPEDFQGRVWRWAPVGYDVTSYSDDTAVVEVWSTSSRTSHTGRSLESGATLISRTELVWESSDWRVSRVGAIEEGREGLDEGLDVMEGVWHAPQG